MYTDKGSGATNAQRHIAMGRVKRLARSDVLAAEGRAWADIVVAKRKEGGERGERPTRAWSSRAIPVSGSGRVALMITRVLRVSFCELIGHRFRESPLVCSRYR